MIKGYVSGKNVTSTIEGRNKLNEWLVRNYNTRLFKNDNTSVPSSADVTKSSQSSLNKELYVLSVAVLIIGILISYYLTQ